MFARLILLILLTVSQAQAHAEIKLSLALGAFLNNGDYGTQQDLPETRMRFAPITLKAQQGNWTARAQTSWIQINGPGNLGEGISRATDQQSESGLGDTLLGLDWRHLQGHWLLEPGIRIKLPTADEDKGLGTGSRDHSAQLGITGLFDQWRPFGLIGYKWRGHSDLIELENGRFGNLGVDYALAKTFSAGIGYDWRQASVAWRPPGREGFAYGNWAISKQWKLMLYAAKGFSASSADKTLGLQTTLSW